MFLGCAALACGAIGYTVAEAQVVEVIELAAQQHPDNVGRFAPLDWDPSKGEHPGKAKFEQGCGTCHTLTDLRGAGPGLRGLEERVPSRARLFKFIMDPKETDDDEYFVAVRREWNDAMQPRGGRLDYTDEDILNIIDYILRHNAIDFDEDAYWRQVRLGRELVSGRTPFTYGGPACASCHSIGADPKLIGANIGPNIGHTYVLARKLGADEEANYADGLYELLSGENAPVAHNYYRDVTGGGPLTESELQLVVTYFEQAARDTGTEQESNYLPIFALLLAAIGLLLLEPSALNVLFAREHGPEYEDGPYKEEEHHHDEPHDEHKPVYPSTEHEPGAPATGTGSPVPAPESKSEEVKSDEVKSEEAKTDEAKPEEPKPDENK